MKQRRQIPVQKGKTYAIDIVRLGTNGEGVGRYENFTVFVPGALPGESVQARVTVVKKQYALAALTEIVKPSPDRVKPLCPVYEQCGGCQLQHLSYEGELKEKRQQVIDALERIGHLQHIDVLPTLGAASPWHYRNKMQVPVAAVGRHSVAIGCFAAATHQVIDVAACAIQKDDNNRIAAVVRQWMKDYKIPAYNEDERTGIVRHIMGRVGVHTGELMVCLVTACDMVPHMKDLVRMLRTALPQIKSIVQNVNTRHTNVILGPKTRVIYGAPAIHDSIGPLTFAVSAQSFFQVNSEQAQKLYETALAFAGLTGKEIVADVYCGTGTITLFLAQQAKQVYGIEIVAPAIKDAVKNARDNHIRNAEFILGDAVYKLPELIRSGIRPDVIVLDPPRAGCGEPVLAAIAQSRPKKVVYVSCNPATLARDLAYLNEHGYAVQKVQPVDMFSRTHHVETVVLLVRR
ncbi:23S rRNA (uracil(1939)-C(5))-methyltransferase RlmD [uncultured Megasphaera sp.]|uniref:23S rRNA (uracil(1939)-C(5))-methyltransferase RlmD n=1 Tax=uncultured Megasphaera sp. TaxID=165188 RepID=UPI0026594625|nr:23S rRNA (uracil(1939)-C(5))-methyltransferase RlmD [uncultured Megasphaera sp.]